MSANVSNLFLFFYFSSGNYFISRVLLFSFPWKILQTILDEHMFEVWTFAQSFENEKPLRTFGVGIIIWVYYRLTKCLFGGFDIIATKNEHSGIAKDLISSHL